MAVESKRMQQRYGTYSQFEDDISNLLPHEFASVTSGDPHTTSGKGLYFKSTSGDPNRILTDEDKDNIDTDIQQLQTNVGTLQSTVTIQGNNISQHTTNLATLNLAMHNANQRIGTLETAMPNKLEQSDMEEYAYSKSTTTNLIAQALSNYYPSSTIDNMLSFGFGQISNSRFAGSPHYAWVKLGFKTVSNQAVGGICGMAIDSPLCTGSNTTLTVPLPFPPATDIKIPVIVGSTQIMCDISANAQSFDITGIQNGDKVSAMIGYRISEAVG